MGFGSAYPGSVRVLAQAWFHSAQPWFGTLVGLGWQLNICIGAGLATLTNQGPPLAPDLRLRIWTGESTRCSTRLSLEFGSGSARDQVGDRLGTREPGFGLAGLGRVGAQFGSFRSEYS